MGQSILIDQYKEMHKDENLYAGSTINLHGTSIGQLIQETKSKTMLDFGCGKAIQYVKENAQNEYFYGIMPSLYDPAVTKYSELPKGEFDGVICTDVLEHIEEHDLDATIKEIFSKATKFVYLGICNIPADSFLPDGRNSHVTLKSFNWWVDKVLPLSNPMVITQVYCYGNTRGNARWQNNNITFRKER